MEEETKGKVGRPTLYSEELSKRICELLMDGLSLNRICKMDEMPSRQTIYNWLMDNDEFLDKYSRAREAQGDFSADYLTDIAEDLREEKLKADQARVMATIHMWVAARRAPRKYGDQISMSTGDKLVVVNTPITQEEALERLSAGPNGPKSE